TDNRGEAGLIFIQFATMLFPFTYDIAILLPDHRGVRLDSFELQRLWFIKYDCSVDESPQTMFLRILKD
ncbi:unnamed protein product, partial [Rotaria sp. Silwood1]